MNIYKCLTDDFDKLQKRINRITKKLDRHGLKWDFEILEENVREVEIIDYRNPEGLPISQFVPKRLGTELVKVTSYRFNMEVLKIGDYETVAVIDHTTEGENVIHNFTDETISEKYRTIDSICEHCNSNRRRNKTILLKSLDTGEIKQVGTTCVKDYTGIDATSVLSIYTDIYNICLEDEPYIEYGSTGGYATYVETIDYLTACIEIIESVGYKKEETKYNAWDLAISNRIDFKYRDTAEKIIEYFGNKDFNNDFLRNTKIYLTEKYTRINGIIAYAYLAYKKQLEYDKQKDTNNHNSSEYQGDVGQRKDFTLTYSHHVSFMTNYGVQYIYIFVDDNGNVFIWKTAKWIDDKYTEENKEKIRLKGTIKEHKEYNGVKQTVITRCKIM